MKAEQREYLLRMAAIFQHYAETNEMIEVTPELGAAWAVSLVSIVDEDTPKIILPGTG
jgi:hypothetical protein